MDGDRIVYNVDAHGGAQRLRRALRIGSLVEQGGPGVGIRGVDESMAPTLEFFYSP